MNKTVFVDGGVGKEVVVVGLECVVWTMMVHEKRRGVVGIAGTCGGVCRCGC